MVIPTALDQTLPAIALLICAASLDYGLGDPWNWLHPVQVMGWIINAYQAIALSHLKSAWMLRWAGVGLGVLMVGGSGFVTWVSLALLNSIHPLLAWGSAVILLASCFAGRSLRDAAWDVLEPLKTHNLDEARTRLSRYVGRDTAQLSSPDILRAVLETVTENATDGVFAPLFYALLGAVLPGVGSVPLAIAYKAASTLDSMIGYRHPPFTDLGWFSARFEDILTWIPCRANILCLAILSGRPRHVWNICRRDAPADPSPNSGWSEAAYAAILGVQVGGLNYYQGIPKPKPFLGDADHAITAGDIQRALELTRLCFLLELCVGCGVLLGIGYIRYTMG